MGLPGRGDEPLTGIADPFLSVVKGEKRSIPVAAQTRACTSIQYDVTLDVFILVNEMTCLYQQLRSMSDSREQDWGHSEELPMGQEDVTDGPRAESEDWKVLPRSFQYLELRSLVLFENIVL